MSSRKFSVECSSGSIRGELTVEGRGDAMPGYVMDEIVAVATKGMNRILVPRLNKGASLASSVIEKSDDPVEYTSSVVLEALGYTFTLDVTVDFHFVVPPEAVEGAIVLSIAPAVAEYAIAEVASETMKEGLTDFLHEHHPETDDQSFPGFMTVSGDSPMGQALGRMLGLHG